MLMSCLYLLAYEALLIINVTAVDSLSLIVIIIIITTFSQSILCLHFEAQGLLLLVYEDVTEHQYSHGANDI